MQAMHDRLVNANQTAAAAPLASIKEENGSKKTTTGVAATHCSSLTSSSGGPAKDFGQANYGATTSRSQRKNSF
jgi:hypothetical protein